MSPNAKCVILVPANYGIEPECERGLVQLERPGYAVWRVPGFAAIDQCRNQLATDALARGFEELFWIDADVAFEPEAVDRLREVVAGLAKPSPRPSPITGEGEAGAQGPEIARAEAHASGTIADTQAPTHHSPTHPSPAYLAEDFSFSYRARAAGVKIFAGTTIRLGHIGRYAYSWEEAGGSNQRFGTYVYRVLDAAE